MRNAILAVLSSIIILVLANFAIGATFEEASAGASVTVNEFVDITIGGVTPINFGAADPGTSNNPAGGAVTVTIESTTNIITDTFLKGNNWVSPAALAISNVKYGDSVSANATMSTTYGAANTGYFENVACPCGGSPAVKSVYFWLSIPAGQQAGAYTSTNIYFKTVTNGATP